MAPSHCPVCGCGELRSDEVLDSDRMLLVECPRCEHRRTERLVVRAALRIAWDAGEEIVAA
jgi:uncharacterized Zn finger protein